ncbi:phage r1t holin [Brevibacterium sanguinis]|uniref:Phage r1t holin n=2 Tax=Brevibacterium TaxID=1696 RepID=A0A366IKZ2_9MICO|nr:MULTISPECIES: holin [Brevibacterium]RBP66451.1 phage r1t holin [Brevibacterium sanguinis]RBP73103.1 phage r1t holin [Brevibacterium celere]
MSTYATKEFWVATGERALKTAAQTAIALIGTDQTGILTLDWGQIVSVTATAVVLSVLTSLVGGAAGSGPSFTKAEVTVNQTEAPPSIVGEEAFFDDQDEVLETDDTPPPAGYEPRH